MNLGLFQHDINVIWDLAPHDLSIMDYLIRKKNPRRSWPPGKSHLNSHVDIAFLTIYFPEMVAHINVNWLSPVKVRTTLIGGEKKMLVWNDLEADEKLKIYDKGSRSRTAPRALVHYLLVSYRSGDMWAPRVEQTEALKAEIVHFMDCIASGHAPMADGLAGLRVVRLLEAAEKSLQARGKLVEIAAHSALGRSPVTNEICRHTINSGDGPIPLHRSPGKARDASVCPSSSASARPSVARARADIRIRRVRSNRTSG